MTEDLSDYRFRRTLRESVVGFNLCTDVDVPVVVPWVVRTARVGSEVEDGSGCETLPGG